MKASLNRSIGIMMSLFITGVFLMGCSTTVENTKSYGYIPSFKIIGDVEDILMITDMKDFTTVEIEDGREKRLFLILQELLSHANPISKEYELLLVGQDGLMAKIDGEGIEECYIGFSKENAWEFVNPTHPISSNIKKVKEIVVISKEENWDYGVNIISNEENIMNITPGNLYRMPSRIFPYFEGTSSIQHQETTYETSIYTEQKIVKIKDLVSLSENEKLLAMGALGEYGGIDGDSYLKVSGNKIDLIEKGGKSKITDVKGIMVDPPITSIMDTYYDVSHYLEKDEKVMILFLDGFGYHQYLYAIENGYGTFLKNIEAAKAATTVYQSVTNAGFAAMITGKPPYENGVYSRKQRDLEAPSIFAVAKALDKKSMLVEADMKILNTEIEPLLNIDRNNNGITCDEVFEASLEQIDKDYDLLMIHFHGIDDTGHSYGDLHEKTMEMISMTDAYIEELVSKWTGRVIITSDHGMHSSLEGGDHGSFRYQDMMVPYVITEGGGRK